MKNETVIGTIGNTHGVKSMANPQRIASMISAQREPSLLASSAEIVPSADSATSLVFAELSEPVPLLESATTAIDEEASSPVFESTVTPSATLEPLSGKTATVPSEDSLRSVSATPVFTGATATRGTENSHASGAAQNLSLHPLQETSPETVASLPVSLTNCVSFTESKKTFSSCKSVGLVTCTSFPSNE